MPNINEIESNIEKIIDDLKGLIQTVGQSNQGYEEDVITSVFLYKFLNDKFMVNLKEFSQKVNMDADEILVENKNGIRDVFYKTYPTILKNCNILATTINIWNIECIHFTFVPKAKNIVPTL